MMPLLVQLLIQISIIRTGKEKLAMGVIARGGLVNWKKKHQWGVG